MTMSSVWQSRRWMAEDLLAQATRISKGFDPNLFISLTGTAADIDSLAYQQLKQVLMVMRRDYPDARFIYLMGRHPDGTIFLYADSESPDSPDYSPPGDIFHEARDTEQLVFHSGFPVFHAPLKDRWGTWATAYVPISDPQTASVLAVLGMDIAREDWNRKLFRAAWPALSVMFIALGLILGAALVVHRRRSAPVSTGNEAWSPEVVLVLLIGALVTVYAGWTANRYESRRAVSAFHHLADSELNRVQRQLIQLRDYFLPPVARSIAVMDSFDAQTFLKLLPPDDGVFSPAWGWVVAVSSDDREAVEATWSAEGREYVIWEVDPEGTPRPVADRPVYFPLRFINDPERDGMGALGFDLGSEPRRRAAIESAALTGLPVATDPLQLVTEAVDRRTMLVLYPVFQDPAREELEGFLLSTLEVRRWFSHLLRTSSVYHQIDLMPLGETDLPIRLLGGAASPASGLPSDAVVRHLWLFGKIFRLSAVPSAAVRVSGFVGAGLWTTLFGMLATISLSALTDMTLRHRRDLERLVRQRTEALSESEQRYALLARQARSIVWEVNEDGRYTYVSDVMTDVLGYEPDELIDRIGLYELAPEEDRFALKDFLNRCIAGKSALFNHEWRMRAKDGRVFWMRSNGVPLIDSDGRRAGYRGWDTDITDRKRVELERERLLEEAEASRAVLLNAMEKQQAAAEEVRRLYAAVEQLPVTVVITDATGAIEYANPAFEAVTGYSRAEAIGQNPRVLKSGKHDDAFYRSLWDTISAGSIWRGRIINKRKDGELIQEEATISPVRDEQGLITHYVAIKRNITQELLREEMLRQAQKMDSIGRLAGGIAHDFNNMLGVILGNAELALEQVDPEQPVYGDLNEICKAARRSADLTRQLLAFARRQAVRPLVLELNDTVSGMLTMLRRLISESITLDFVPDRNPAPVRMDPSQLDQLLVNLCVNARDAIEDSGMITIRTQTTSLTPDDCEGREGVHPGEYVVLSVADTGRGMDRETLEHAFEPFFTTKKKGEGTGLGLATVYGIARQSGGFVEVESQRGQGAVFSIYLPRHNVMSVEIVEQAAMPSLAGSHETILLVEDEPGVLSITRRMLQRLGYEVLAAATPKEALAIAEAQRDRIALLLTDVIMPDMNGRELSERILAIKPGLPCLFMSGYSAEVITSKGIVWEGIHFVPKPFTAESLAEAVRETLADVG